MDYDTFRHAADSWGLMGLLLFFVFAVLWAFRPGSSKHYREAALLPLNDDRHGANHDRK